MMGSSIGVWCRDMGNNEKPKERRLEVNVMRMLRWMYGVTKIDKIRKKHWRESEKVAPVTKKSTEQMLRTCQEKGRRAHAKKNVRCTSTRNEMERKT